MKRYQIYRSAFAAFLILAAHFSGWSQKTIIATDSLSTAHYTAVSYKQYGSNTIRTGSDSSGFRDITVGPNISVALHLKDNAPNNGDVSIAGIRFRYVLSANGTHAEITDLQDAPSGFGISISADYRGSFRTYNYSNGKLEFVSTSSEGK